jgi:hypothetical protein
MTRSIRSTKEYSENARYRRDMADWAATPRKLKADWLRLADKWVSMAPVGERHLNSRIAAGTPRPRRVPGSAFNQNQSAHVVGLGAAANP